MAQIEQGDFDLDSEENEDEPPDDEGEKLNTLKKNSRIKTIW